MKNLITFCLTLFLASTVIASDVLTLENGHTYEGKVIAVNQCSVEFEFDDAVYAIPAQDVATVFIEDMTKRTAKKLANMLAGSDNCWKGMNDGANHGKQGGQFLCGVAFGAFGVIGCAVTNRTPMKSSNLALMTQNKDLWNDAEYLNCYNKEARSKAVNNSLLGWATWVLLILI
jgi:hypothetical protein